VQIDDLSSPLLDEQIDDFAAKLREDIALIDGVYDRFDADAYLTGDSAPVFFGSAVNNVGIRELLDTFCEIAPVPRPRMTDKRQILPDEASFSGFVFKIHANLDPKHRNRMVFVRVCSGVFERSKYYHHVRLGKELRFAAPVSFVGQKRETIDTAYPGDVVGLFDVGNFKIGDTLTEGENFQFQGIPSFSPEIFRLLTNKSFEKVKQLEKGLLQLTDEGVAQLFIQDQGRRKIIGTVGQLQFEVLQYRLEHEYGALCEFVPLSFTKACWITANDPKKIGEFCKYRGNAIATDKDGLTVFFAESDHMLRHHIAENPDIEFHTTSEFKRRA
jgi:peptide chain release factor 3